LAIVDVWDVVGREQRKERDVLKVRMDAPMRFLMVKKMPTKGECFQEHRMLNRSQIK
jgi:hypothetical protein